MKTEDRYLKFVRWSPEDAAYVGFCPDIFPWGGVCHGADEEATYHALRDLVRVQLRRGADGRARWVAMNSDGETASVDAADGTVVDGDTNGDGRYDRADVARADLLDTRP